MEGGRSVATRWEKAVNATVCQWPAAVEEEERGRGRRRKKEEIEKGTGGRERERSHIIKRKMPSKINKNDASI